MEETVRTQPPPLPAAPEGSGWSPAAMRLWAGWLAAKGSAKSGTVQTYRRVFNEALPLLAEIVRESGGDLGPAEVRAYLDRLQKGVKPKALATIALHWSVLASFWDYLQAMGYCRHNPWRFAQRQRLPIRIGERILTEAEVRGLTLAATRPRDRLLLRFLYLTGARVSEAVNVRWRDIAPQGERIVVTLHGKGGKTRWVALPRHLYEDLRNSCPSQDPDAPVFPSRYRAKDGPKPISRRTAERIVERAAVRAGFARRFWDAQNRVVVVRWVRRPSPHWLRHSHASHALLRGAPIHYVQQTLGHASLATTGQYLHMQAGESSGSYLEDPAAQVQTEDEG